MTNDAFNIPEHAEGPVLRRASSDDTAASAGETSDDILAKYRKKPLAAEDKVDGLVDMEVEESRRPRIHKAAGKPTNRTGGPGAHDHTLANRMLVASL